MSKKPKPSQRTKSWEKYRRALEEIARVNVDTNLQANSALLFEVLLIARKAIQQ